jgi:glyoxylase-like metal-dependent hydrolase (beta-lactamase superfamily II)
MSDIRTLNLPMPLGMGSVNAYLLTTPSGHVLIDTGSASARQKLLDELAASGCTPGSLRLILLTHGDFDHIGNAAYLRSVYSARIALHPADGGMAEQGDMFSSRKQPGVLLRLLLPLFARLGQADRFSADLLLSDGQDLTEWGLPGKVVALSGHSGGSVGIRMEGGEFFCGDLIENIKTPRLGSIMDDVPVARESIRKLAGMDLTTVYPGHGQPFDFAEWFISEGEPGEKNPA